MEGKEIICKKVKRLRQVTLAQGILAIEKSEAVATATYNKLRESLDCPDCSDMILKFYD